MKITIHDYCSIRWINQIPYARHYNPLLIRNRSWILTIHKARILRKKPFEKTFLDFKKWVKSIQSAGYNGARTVDVLRKNLQSTSGWFQILQQTAKAFRGLAMLRCPNKSSVKVAYNLRWRGDILTKSTCSNLGGKFCRRTRWLLRCTKPYNEFITCFYESWFYETWTFFHEICRLLWSILNNY